MNFMQVSNVSRPYRFFKEVPPGERGQMEHRLAEHGFVDKIRIRFAAGENGTLRVRPVIIINPGIIIDIFKYPVGGDKWLTGDFETIEESLNYEIEANARLVVFYENTATDPETTNSQVNVNIGVTYYQKVEPENVIGPRSPGFFRGLANGW